MQPVFVIMLKKMRDSVRQQVDIISPSRYISHVRTHGNRLVSTALQERFVGRNGLLVQADCLDLLANMLPDSVDLVFVYPPFNISKPYESSEFHDRYDPEF